MELIYPFCPFYVLLRASISFHYTEQPAQDAIFNIRICLGIRIIESHVFIVTVRHITIM